MTDHLIRSSTLMVDGKVQAITAAPHRVALAEFITDVGAVVIRMESFDGNCPHGPYNRNVPTLIITVGVNKVVYNGPLLDLIKDHHAVVRKFAEQQLRERCE